MSCLVLCCLLLPTAFTDGERRFLGLEVCAHVCNFMFVCVCVCVCV
jgi:hypothetical protein